MGIAALLMAMGRPALRGLVVAVPDRGRAVVGCLVIWGALVRAVCCICITGEFQWALAGHLAGQGGLGAGRAFRGSLSSTKVCDVTGMCVLSAGRPGAVVIAVAW